MFAFVLIALIIVAQFVFGTLLRLHSQGEDGKRGSGVKESALSTFFWLPSPSLPPLPSFLSRLFYQISLPRAEVEAGLHSSDKDGHDRHDVVAPCIL